LAALSSGIKAPVLGPLAVGFDGFAWFQDDFRSGWLPNIESSAETHYAGMGPASKKINNIMIYWTYAGISRLWQGAAGFD
jgi:hypothetical protein